MTIAILLELLQEIYIPEDKKETVRDRLESILDFINDQK
jgi:hypothetical protein